MFVTLTNLLFSPLSKIGKKYKQRKLAAFTEYPPTSPPNQSDCEIGEYCIRATVETHNDKGEKDKTFVGYSKNLEIVEKTKNVCDRFKRNQTECQEPIVSFLGGDCIEQIFMKEKNGELIRIGIM